MMSSVALFAGGGLASIALRRAGFKDVFANDYDEQIARCFKLNHPEAVMCTNDIGKVNSVSDIPQDAIGCDMLFAGVECDATAICGKKRHDNPKLEHLWSNTARLISAIKPKVAVIENSPVLVTMFEHLYARFRDALRIHGYHVQTYVIDASFHGSVQQRKRTFIIATQRRFELELVLQDQRALVEVCPDIRAVEVGQSNRHWRSSHLPSLTITESGGAQKVIRMNNKEGKMEVKEGEAIMGIRPGEYQWPNVSTTLKWRVLGNGVACELVEQIGRELAHHIRDNH